MLGLYCNCCNYRVTSRPRSKFYNEKLKNYKEMKALAEQDSENEIQNASLDFEDLNLFITEIARPQANYQFVVIKTLLESNNVSSIDNIVTMLELYNQDKPSQDYRKVPVFSVLNTESIPYTIEVKQADALDELEAKKLTGFGIWFAIASAMVATELAILGLRKY